MNARAQTLIAALMVCLALVIFVGGVVWSLNTPMTFTLATVALALGTALLALGLLALAWIVALLILRSQGRAALSARWLILGLLAMGLSVVALWSALSIRSLPLHEWGVALELLGLLSLLGALLSPVLGLLALGVLVIDAAEAKPPLMDDSLPAYWSAARLTAEEVARERVETAEAPLPAAVGEGIASDDLTQIKGIGPKTAAALATGGITTFKALASARREDIVRILREAGVRAGDVDSWRGQASHAARGESLEEKPGGEAA